MHSTRNTSHLCLRAGLIIGLLLTSICHIAVGDEVYGYNDTPFLPDSEFRVHDPARPQSPHVDPGPPVASRPPPADALVLFDGTDLSHWTGANWAVENGEMLVRHGDIETRRGFGDVQLHIEFLLPDQPHENLTDRGNSGVFFMQQYELQIFGSHPDDGPVIYADGQCAAIYGQTPPRVNASRRLGEWQTYDIVFTAPRFADGQLTRPAKVTMFHNGVLVHLEQPFLGPTVWRALPHYSPHPDRLPLRLQEHGSPIRFRNIWIREL